MTKKEINELNKETAINIVSDYVGGDTKKLDSKNKKMLKEMLSKDLKKVIACLLYIKDDFFSWEITHKDNNINANFDRMIYLFNSYYSDNILTDVSEHDTIEKDDILHVKSNHKTLNYIELAEGVGL